MAVVLPLIGCGHACVADFRAPGTSINTAARFLAKSGFREVVDTSIAVDEVDALHLEDAGLLAGRCLIWVKQ